MKTTTPIQIRFNDIDMARHVHNGMYLSYFEQGRMAFLRTFIPKDHDWQGAGLILARNEVDYRRPVHLDAVVEVDTWCSNVGTKSFDLSYGLFVLENGKRTLHCQGRSVMVCFDYARNMSIPVPPEWRTALARMMEQE